MQNDGVDKCPLLCATMRVLDYAVSIIDGYVSSGCSVVELDLANFRNTMETFECGKLRR